MADIRVEKKSGGHAWVWVLVAVIVLIAAVVLLDRAGYIQLPRFGMPVVPADSPAQLASAGALPQEV
jgi:hypothetical protein